MNEWMKVSSLEFSLKEFIIETDTDMNMFPYFLCDLVTDIFRTYSEDHKVSYSAEPCKKALETLPAVNNLKYVENTN